MTAEEVERLRAELDRLKTEGRRQSREELAKARSFGDFRENAEYDEAKRAHAVLEGRIRELGDLLGSAQVVEAAERDRVTVGATVTAHDLETLEEIRFNLRATGPSDPDTIPVTPSSPIGRGLMGKTMLDVVAVDTPSGERRYRILSVTFPGQDD
jgi:transcription elongation factor GreA